MRCFKPLEQVELVPPWLIGLGSFGRVKLSRNKKTNKYYAMKILKKAEIIRLKQVDHVISENTILANINHPFIVCFH